VIELVREFYARNKISATDFDCPSQNRCKAAAEKLGGSFTPVRELTLGERYLDSFPKIVVVSLDPGSLDEPASLNIRSEAASDEDLGPQRRHWYRTHEGVAILVEAATKQKITVGEAALWFAHTSVVRCCANLRGRAQAPWQMFWSLPRLP